MPFASCAASSAFQFELPALDDDDIRQPIYCDEPPLTCAVRYLLPFAAESFSDGFAPFAGPVPSPAPVKLSI